jgi:hypothetical protein
MSGSRKLEKKLGLHRKQAPNVNVDAIKKVGDILNQRQGTRSQDLIVVFFCFTFIT